MAETFTARFWYRSPDGATLTEYLPGMALPDDPAIVAAAHAAGKVTSTTASATIVAPAAELALATTPDSGRIDVVDKAHLIGRAGPELFVPSGNDDSGERSV